jgi:uncharacterized repeat protein (TIGR04138 family)
MQALRFDSAVENILLRDRRFEAGAYFFLKDALDFTLKRTREEGGEERHVSGEELLHGFRDYAIQEFGPMAHTLLLEWGVRTSSDVGDMVFHLIEEGMFGKQDSDSKQDFHDIYDFDQTFQEPFVPAKLPRQEPSRPSPRPAPGSGPAAGDEETPFSAAPRDAS